MTDAAALAAAVEAAGSTRMEVEAALSRALSVGVVRRHARGAEGEGLHYGPAVRVASGNWVTGRRRGVVDGIDFGATGSGAGWRLCAECTKAQPHSHDAHGCRLRWRPQRHRG